MRHELADYLLRRGWIDVDTARRAASSAQGFREAIGAIALRNELLTPRQVDDILRGTTRSGRRFGEVAVDHGYLTADQVQRLLDVQTLEEAMSIGSVLVLEGLMTPERFVTRLDRFFSEVGGSVRAS